MFKTQAAMLLERLELVLRAVAAQLHIIWQLHAQNERNTLELLGKIINLINPVRFGKWSNLRTLILWKGSAFEVIFSLYNFETQSEHESEA